jgi:ATP-dependent RNA helicase DeaD
MPSFSDFSLQPATLTLLTHMEITEPTPIQSEAIPALLAGRDLVGQSATGSGKTLAYGIPLIERLTSNKRAVQALVLVPTRELAVQVNAVLSKLAANRRLSTALLVGGRPYGKQNAALRYGAQIVVGTPGRIKDHIEQGTLVLNQTRICILDEADQMLDIGFAPVIEDILGNTPDTRQMALFSATIPDWVAKLEQKFLKDPVKVTITAATGGQSTIEQIAYQVPQDQKMAALCTLLQSAEGESTLIFGRTKFGVEKLGQQLSKLGFTVGTLHGNKSQRAREDVLTAFRRGHVQTLLATNVAARGLDIQGIYQVINYELPESSELFTHRIGRTGRMGRQGKAITLLVPADVSKWRRMARSLGQTVTLERLAINETAALIPLITRPTIAVPQEREQYSEPRPMRGRKAPFPTRKYERDDEPTPLRGRKPFPAGQEQEPYREQWPARSRKPASLEQEQATYRELRPARVRKPAPAAQEYERRDESKPARTDKPSWYDQENESDGEQWPARGRQSSAPEQERGRSFGTGRASRPAPRVPGRRAENAAGGRPVRPAAWQSEGFSQSERPSSEARNNRRGSARPSSFGRNAGKRQTTPFITTESEARKQPTTAPALRIRKNVAAKRSAGR